MRGTQRIEEGAEPADRDSRTAVDGLRARGTVPVERVPLRREAITAGRRPAVEFRGGPGSGVGEAAEITPVADPQGVSGRTSSGPRAQTCTEVASPRRVPLDPLPSLAPLGAIETTEVDQFTDDYLYSPSGEFKIGTRREWGSTVVFFGMADGEPGINQTNTIDANDTGRELQVALYDYPRLRQGCAWNASCKKDVEEGCGKEITFLGWNPVQGGNRCNNGSPVIDAKARRSFGGT